MRFAYFPLLRTFYFRDFSNKEERVDRALRSFDIAVHRGWPTVAAAMSAYRSKLAV